MSRQSLPTLKAASQHLHHEISLDDTALHKPSCPKTQTAETNAKCKDDQEAISHAIDEWYSYTLGKAEELAIRFDKKPRYFLDHFFAGGQKMIHKHTVTNPFNAFISMKAAELRAEGERENIVQLHKDFKTEYEALTAEERADYVTEFEALKDCSTKIRRHTSRGCIQDAANVARNMQIMLDNLKTRVGVEGFFCIVRNNTEFHMSPIWHFSSKELSEYMPVAVGKKWVASNVGSKLEAFAIAGSDVINLNHTSQQKASQMKREISDIVGARLVQITGNTKIQMQYVNYEEAIVLKYGVELVGWTHEKFANPSELSNALQPLRTLLEALKNESCTFVRLSPLERRTREAKYRNNVAFGAIAPIVAELMYDTLHIPQQCSCIQAAFLPSTWQTSQARIFKYYPKIFMYHFCMFPSGNFGTSLIKYFECAGLRHCMQCSHGTYAAPKCTLCTFRIFPSIPVLDRLQKVQIRLHDFYVSYHTVSTLIGARELMDARTDLWIIPDPMLYLDSC